MDKGGAEARSYDRDRTRADILDVARQVFAYRGLDGARVDEIAALTRTSKRMIYYYFESKEGLYRDVLTDCYRRINAVELPRDLAGLPPLEGLAALVVAIFDHQQVNSDLLRLVMVENVHRGAHLLALPDLGLRDSAAVVALREICARGVAAGTMRADVDPLDLHMSISALSVFSVSNQHTFSRIFQVDMASPAARARRRASVAEMIIRYVSAGESKNETVRP
jgi:AcrR family transcriptional regulator